jgi:23S rRNA G2445 N2-methylase RlmL
MNILHAKLRAKKGGIGKMAEDDTVFTVLDPCCGSGTTLFVARR